ncbi:MAG: hypothetical protein ACTIC8_03795, partial [Leuconostoc falkenbergense]
ESLSLVKADKVDSGKMVLEFSRIRASVHSYVQRSKLKSGVTRYQTTYYQRLSQMFSTKE